MKATAISEKLTFIPPGITGANLRVIGDQGRGIVTQSFGLSECINSVNYVYDLIKSEGYKYAIPAFFSGKLVNPELLNTLSRPHFKIIDAKWNDINNSNPIEKAVVFNSYLNFFLKSEKVHDIAESYGTSYQAIGERYQNGKSAYYVLFKDGRVNEVKEEKILWNADGKGGVGLDKKWPVSQDKLSSVSEEFSNLFLFSLAIEYSKNPGKNSLYRRMSDISLDKLSNKQYVSGHIWFALTRQYADNFKNQGVLDKCLKDFRDLNEQIGPNDIFEKDGDYFKWKVEMNQIKDKSSHLDKETNKRIFALWRKDRRNSVLARFVLDKGDLLSVLNTFWDEIQIPRLKNDSTTKSANPLFTAQFERSYPTFCINADSWNNFSILGREILKRGY